MINDIIIAFRALLSIKLVVKIFFNNPNTINYEISQTFPFETMKLPYLLLLFTTHKY